MQAEIRVVQSEVVFEPDDVYDVNITVPVVWRDKYQKRLEHFKRCGFYNVSACKVHLTLIGSVADWACRNEISAGWPDSFHVSVLAVNDERPLPKISAGYLWQQEQGPQARWHLRVDDDSMTDLGGLLGYVDRQYGCNAVHVMTSPYYNDCTNGPFIPYLKRAGIHLPVYANEHESSITSDCTMRLVFAHPPAMDFLRFTCQVFDSQSDKCLPLAMLVAQVPTAINPVSSKRFAMDALSLTGGSLFHIHYVDWENPVFTPLVTAFLCGQRQALAASDLDEMIHKPLSFGRCLGEVLAELTLRPDGMVEVGRGTGAARWVFVRNCLRLTDVEGRATTGFETVLSHGSRAWLIGPCFAGCYIHFLCL